MTEQEAVEKLKAYAAEYDCLCMEANENAVRRFHRFQNPFVIGWRYDSTKDKKNAVVTFFSFCKSPIDPPKEVLSAFRHLQKVNVRPAGRSLEWMKYLPAVKSLEIYEWNGELLPEKWIGGESSVERLYLHTKTGEVPSLLRHLKLLRQLGMDSDSDCAIELPEWLPQLNKLERVYLRNCRIKKIPESLWRMNLPFIADDAREKRGIFLHRAQLTDMGDLTVHDFTPPAPGESADAYEKRRKKIERHYEIQRENGKEVKSECMVIFLGDGSAGKSSLIDRLMDRSKAFRIGESLPTNGVKMRLWSTEIDGKDYNLRMLDFGGQEIMHSIHRCFMTDHTVYVVVCESRSDPELDSNVIRWLETVRTFAPLSPVILALNKADTNPYVSVNERDLTDRYPMLKEVLKTTALSDPKYADAFPLDALEKAIKKRAEECASNILAKPEWFAVRQELENLRDKREGWSAQGPQELARADAGNGEEEEDYNALRGDYIIEDDYKRICKEHGITKPEEQRDMLDWFRDLGVVYSYENNDDGEIDIDLEGVRVLNPEWLSNGIYRIILHAPVNTFVTNAEIRDTLNHIYEGDIVPTKYIRRKVKDVPSGEGEEIFDEPKFILHVMRKFSLSKRANTIREDGVEERREMIPSRFTRNAPKERDNFPTVGALHIQWVGQYLPNNLVHRLMIRLFPQLDQNCIWRTGGRFLAKRSASEADLEDFRSATEEDFEVQALVTLNDLGLDLYVNANPKTEEAIDLRKYYLERLRGEILSIMKEMRLDPQEWPCFRVGEGKEKREVKLSLSEAMMWLDDVSKGDRAFAYYTAKEEQDEKVGDFLNVREALQSVYLNFNDMLRDYRERGAPPGDGERMATQAVRSVSPSVPDWIERRAFLRDAYYALTDNAGLSVYAIFALALMLLALLTIIFAVPPARLPQ